MAVDSHDIPEGDQRLPPAVVEDIQSSPRCERFLDALADSGGEMPIRDAARAVCARERGVDADSVPADDCNAVYEDIYERHLPKLTATGIVRFDSLTDSVELRRPDVLPDAETA